MPARFQATALLAAGALTALTAVTALAAGAGLAPPGIDELRFGKPVTAKYRCAGGKSLTVRYLNSPDNQIAMVPLDGKPLLFVSVLTGSGARYAHGRHQWITKGNDGMLVDLTLPEGAPPVLADCKSGK